MCRHFRFLLLLTLPTLLFADDRLPTPDYHRQPSDPEWLAQVVQFHGHLGPAVVAGARMGIIGLRAVEAKGYFDVEVTCEGPFAKPPQACFLDGVQVATGATMGKRTLNWVESDQIVVRVKNTRTGKTAELRPTPALMELLGAFKPQPKVEATHGPAHQDHERLEAIARKIAVMPPEELVRMTVHRPGLQVPEHIERGMMMDPVLQENRLREMQQKLDPAAPPIELQKKRIEPKK